MTNYVQREIEELRKLGELTTEVAAQAAEIASDVWVASMEPLCPRKSDLADIAISMARTSLHGL